MGTPALRLALFTLCIGALATVMTAAYTWSAVSESATSWRWVDHTYEVADTLEKLLTNITSAESAGRGFSVTGDNDFISTLGEEQAAAWRNFDLLSKLTKDNPDQQAGLPKLRTLIHDKFAWIDKGVLIRRNKGFEALKAMAATGTGVRLMDSIKTACQKMQTRERELLSIRHRETDARVQRLRLSTVLTSAFSLVLFFGSAGLGVAILRNQTRRLHVATKKTESLAQQRDALKTMAATDGLTGLANHKAFATQLAAEFALATRTQEPFSLILIDVDHFKKYNDSFGHLAGNEVLKQVARILEVDRRSSDLVARFGGEEFAVLLRGVDSDQGMVVAERIRRSVEAAEWSGRPVTVSLGIASFDLAKERPEAIIEAADQALYAAKDAGRNCVRSAEPVHTG